MEAVAVNQGHISRQILNHNGNSHQNLLSVLTSSSSLIHVRQIHAHMLRIGLECSTTLVLKLISLCATSSNSLDYALAVFNEVSEHDTRLCNRIFREISRSKEPEKALLLYEKIRRDGSLVDRFSFPPILKAASRVSAIRETMEMHGLVSKLGFNCDPFIETALVRAYAGCGRIFDARQVFNKMSERDVVTWSVMFDGYARCGHYDDVLRLFEEIKSSGLEPDEVILVTVLSACARSGNLAFGKLIHESILTNNTFMDAHLQSALINMYVNCGSLEIAHQMFVEMSERNLVASTAMVCGYCKSGEVNVARDIFDQMPEKDLICWSAMISGYAENDRPNEALNLFNEMLALGIKPDKITILSVISACSQLGVLDQAKWISMFVDKNGFGRTLSINNALIDMYSKCGSLSTALELFNKMPQKNVISWTSMITGLAMHGEGESAIQLFHKMKSEGIEPNAITFVGVLYACSHAGLVVDGRQLFDSMINDYNITPKMEHYGCMVDLLGRTNLLEEATRFIDSMPFEPNVVIWGSLLSACKVHGNIELGELAAKKIFELDPNHDGAHVLLSNIYAKAGRWDKVSDVRNLMKERRITKERGTSWIEFNSKIHGFLMGDKLHPQAEKIYCKLEEIVMTLKSVGYIPNKEESVLVDLDEEEKRDSVLLHSEKLALSFGLINIEMGTCIRIVKNLRICEDCHTFMKLVSSVFEREIIVRDRTRFHHYRNGVCSCKDFW